MRLREAHKGGQVEEVNCNRKSLSRKHPDRDRNSIGQTPPSQYLNDSCDSCTYQQRYKVHDAE